MLPEPPGSTPGRRSRSSPSSISTTSTATCSTCAGTRRSPRTSPSETFEKALRLWRRFDPLRGSARTWLLAIARTTALDWFRAEERRRRREQRSRRRTARRRAGEGLSPALEQALASLTAGEREVIALRVVLELDGEAAARVLGISQTACSTRLSRALKKLEERMTDDLR